MAIQIILKNRRQQEPERGPAGKYIPGLADLMDDDDDDYGLDEDGYMRGERERMFGIASPTAARNNNNIGRTPSGSLLSPKIGNTPTGRGNPAGLERSPSLRELYGNISTDLHNFLLNIGCERWSPILHQRNIQVETLGRLSDDDLQKIGISTPADRNKILASARMFLARRSSVSNNNNNGPNNIAEDLGTAMKQSGKAVLEQGQAVTEGITNVGLSFFSTLRDAIGNEKSAALPPRPSPKAASNLNYGEVASNDQNSDISPQQQQQQQQQQQTSNSFNNSNSSFDRATNEMNRTAANIGGDANTSAHRNWSKARQVLELQKAGLANKSTLQRNEDSLRRLLEREGMLKHIDRLRAAGIKDIRKLSQMNECFGIPQDEADRLRNAAAQYMARRQAEMDEAQSNFGTELTESGAELLNSSKQFLGALADSMGQIQTKVEDIVEQAEQQTKHLIQTGGEGHNAHQQNGEEEGGGSGGVGMKKRPQHLQFVAGYGDGKASTTLSHPDYPPMPKYTPNNNESRPHVLVSPSISSYSTSTSTSMGDGGMSYQTSSASFSATSNWEGPKYTATTTEKSSSSSMSMKKGAFSFSSNSYSESYSYSSWNVSNGNSNEPQQQQWFQTTPTAAISNVVEKLSPAPHVQNVLEGARNTAQEWTSTLSGFLSPAQWSTPQPLQGLISPSSNLFSMPTTPDTYQQSLSSRSSQNSNYQTPLDTPSSLRSNYNNQGYTLQSPSISSAPSPPQQQQVQTHREAGYSQQYPSLRPEDAVEMSSNQQQYFPPSDHQQYHNNPGVDAVPQHGAPSIAGRYAWERAQFQGGDPTIHHFHHQQNNNNHHHNHHS